MGEEQSPKMMAKENKGETYEYTSFSIPLHI